MRVYLKILFIIIALFIVFTLFKTRKYQDNKPVNNDTVWTYWDSLRQPEIVKRCIKNLEKVGGCKDIRVLNKNTVNTWIPKNEMNEFSKITNNEANKSDLIRLYLLKTYGGIWIDASVFANKNIFSWLPDDKNTFCYKADRFSKDGVVCLENFFIKAKKNYPLINDWFNQSVEDFKDKNYKENNKKFRNIIGKNGDYLVPYVSSMKLDLKRYPHLITHSAEKGPYKDTVENGWDPKRIVTNISYDQNLVKLYNGPRKEASPDIVPMTKANEDFLPNNVYNRFKNRFEIVQHDNKNVEVDMIYCICMPQRRDYAKKMVGMLQTPYKLFNAIKPDDLSTEDYTRLSQTYVESNKHLYKQWTKIPVALSFFTCYYDAYKNGYDTILVLEDDIRYKVSLDKIYGAIRDFKQVDSEILFLGYCWANCGMTYQHISEHLYIAPYNTEMLCNHALVMKKSFIKAYMERDEVTFWRHRNDHTLSTYLIKNKINKCVTSPVYIDQNREKLGSTNHNNNHTKLPTCTLHTSYTNK
jgi:hypothetical protein